MVCPIIFTAVADALEYIVKARGVRVLGHYLANMTCLAQTCEQPKVPLAPHKCEGPSTCLKFLGIEIDTVSMELRLPADKLQRVKKLVQEWLGKDSGHKKDLE